jgi:5-methylcytosine-specific restriction endonuclease McrA
MTTYSTSSGERLEKSTIDFRICEAKKKVLANQLYTHGYHFCEECKRTNVILDCSHIVSVKECQESGRSELAWDESNIEVYCRSCHQKRDKLNLQWTKL